MYFIIILDVYDINPPSEELKLFSYFRTFQQGDNSWDSGAAIRDEVELFMTYLMMPEIFRTTFYTVINMEDFSCPDD